MGPLISDNNYIHCGVKTVQWHLTQPERRTCQVLMHAALSHLWCRLVIIR